MRAAWLLLAAAAWAQPPCAVQGVVTDRSTGEPLAAVKLFLAPRAPQPLPSLLQRTNPQGAFCFAEVDEGDYVLRAQRSGYLDAAYGNGLTLSVRPDAGLAPLAVKLVRRAILSGTVIDGEGEPVSGAQVSVYRRTRDNTDEEEMDSQQTDDRGVFRFDGLAPGTYYVGANLRNDPAREFNMPFLDADGKPRQEGYLETFYSAAARVADAKPLALEAGKDVSGLLLTLRKAQLHSISGKAPGAPQGSYIALRYPNGNGSGLSPGPDGAFYVGGLEPGAYSLELRQNNQILGKKDVDLTSDLEGVVIAADQTPPATFTLAVQFRTEGPGPPYRPSPRTFTFLQQADGNGGSSAQPKPDGTFQFANLTPGQYTLVTFAWGEDDYYVKRILLGGQAIAGRAVDLRHGDPGGIQVVLAMKSASIKGRIADHATLSQAVTVLLVDDTGRIQEHAVTDQTGRFRIEHAAAGKFRLFAVEEFSYAEWSRERAAALREKSLAIELGEGEAKEVELPLIRSQEPAAK